MVTQSMVLTNMIIAVVAFVSSLGLWVCSKAVENGKGL